MEKLKFKKILSLDKKKIAKLDKEQTKSLKGGADNHSHWTHDPCSLPTDPQSACYSSAVE